MKITKIITFTLLSGVIILLSVIGSDISISQQLPMLEALRNVSAIVFGICGAWIAIVLPSSLQNLFNIKTLKVGKSEYGKLLRLLRPIKISAIIIAYTLLFQLMYPVARLNSFLESKKPTFEGLSFGVLALLVTLEIAAIFQAIAPGDEHIELAQKRKSIRTWISRLKNNDNK